MENQNRVMWLVMAVGTALVVLGVIFSVLIGSIEIPIGTIWEAISGFDSENSMHLLVVKMRLPRAVGGILVGMALAVAGAVMQGITGNPLADSGILGISAGATLALSLIIGFFPSIPYTSSLIIAFVGASVSAGVVYMISQTADSAGLILSGACLSGLLTALSQAFALSKGTTQSLAFWTLGSLGAIDASKLYIAFPVIIVSVLGAIRLSRQISAVSMGEEVAIGLGVKVNQTKQWAILLVVLLSGTAVALAGMIAFVGLMVPHVCRRLVGNSYRRIIPCSAVLGAVLMVYSDIGAKCLTAPAELPVGAVIAMIGAPMFLYVGRRAGA